MKRILAAAAFACFAAAAHAQPAQEMPLAGAWTFETAEHRESRCIIRGEALVRPKREENLFDVEMRVTETCPGGAHWRADERCTARRAARAVEIACTLVRADGGYNPDQFSLTVETASAMRGRLYDHGYWNEPVRWARSLDAPVS